MSALVLCAGLAGCGGGATGADSFVESLARLLTARFVPASLAMPRGSTRTVDLEVVCDWAGLNTAFGRLGIRVRLDPDRTLPAGFSATLNRPLDTNGFAVFPCTGVHPDPNLRIAHVAVEVRSLANAPTSATLGAFVEVEPLLSGDPSKDSTRADLAVTVTPGEGSSPTS
jgi:hypothetical protein